MKYSQKKSLFLPMQALTGFPSGSGFIPFEYRPKRGPSIAADANADAPPIKWTGLRINIIVG